MVTEINNVEQLIAELNEDFCVLKIYSNHCMPCKIYDPEFNKLTKEYEGINFLNCCIDKKILNVNSVPTTLIIKDGNIVDKMIGGNIEKLHSIIEENIK